MTSYEFFVPGIPVPKGSAKAFYNPTAGRVVVRQDNAERQKPWASLISLYTAREIKAPLKVPAVDLLFVLPRPKAHYKANGEVKNQYKNERPTQRRNDIDKLARCVLDALDQGGAYVDDGTVVALKAWKVYGYPTGCHITVTEQHDGAGMVEMEV